MPIGEILSEQQRQQRVWRRIKYLLLITLFAVLVIYLIVAWRSDFQTRHQSWIDTYGQQILNQQEKLLALSLIQKQHAEQTEAILAVLREQEVVIDATLYDAKGQQLSQLQAQTSQQLLHHYSSSAPQILLREIWHEKQLLGYLRLVIDRQFILKQNDKISSTEWFWLLVTALLASIFGILLGMRVMKIRQK